MVGPYPTVVAIGSDEHTRVVDDVHAVRFDVADAS